MSSPVITLSDNPLLLTYASCAMVLCLKVLSMVFLTGRARIAKGVYSNPEDIVNKEKAKVKFDDVDVERVRRAHLNDLENIPIFLVVSLLYITIGQPGDLPSVALGKALMLVFTFSRIAHTIIYVMLSLPQSARGISFTIGFIITIYMAIATLLRIASLTA